MKVLLGFDVKIFRWVAVVIIFCKLFLSFNQYYYFEIDGDLALVVAPNENFSHVLEDPFGISILKNHIPYSAPNRFFAHWLIYSYYRLVPSFLQNFTSPIDSLYYANAIFKLSIHLIFLYGLSVAISRCFNIFKNKFIFAALLVTPIFQNYGQNSHLGLVHSSITYAIFYSLPVALFGLFLLPYFLKRRSFKPTSIGYKLFLIGLCIYLSFNGSLGAPLFMLVSFLNSLSIFFMLLKENKYSISLRLLILFFSKITSSENWIWITFVFIGLYSFYIGSFNSESLTHSVNLYNRFKLLPIGVLKLFTEKSGAFVLLLSCVINSFFLLKFTDYFKEKEHRSAIYWLLLFCLLYTFLLPFGGYRDYRPYIVRGDSYLPVLLVFVYYYGHTSLTLFQTIKGSGKKIWVVYILLISGYYFYKDGKIEKRNSCEIAALKCISASQGSLVEINSDCSIINWTKIYTYEESKYYAEFLYIVNVTKTRKKFRNKPL